MTAMIFDTNDAVLLGEAVLFTLAIIATGSAALYAYTQRRRQSHDAYTVLKSEVDELMRERQQDYELLKRLQIRVTELEIGVRVLIAQIVRGGDVPEWSLAPDAPAEVPQPRPLHETLSYYFNNEELDDLAARVGIDHEALAGRTRIKRAQSLVEAATRLSLSDALLAAARELRPKGDI